MSLVRASGLIGQFKPKTHRARVKGAYRQISRHVKREVAKRIGKVKKC